MINAHQTKDEEVGSLPEKEFRIMIVQMNQNLENKMELQINSLLPGYYKQCCNEHWGTRVSFNLYNAFKVNLYCSMYQYFILFMTE